MARIFYRLDGSIYGVHPGPHEDNPKITLPDGVAWFDVPETPDQIPWLVPADRNDLNPRQGEHWSRVNPATRAVEVDPAKVPPPNPDEALQKAIEGATTLQDLKDALLGKTRPGRVPGVRP